MTADELDEDWHAAARGLSHVDIRWAYLAVCDLIARHRLVRKPCPDGLLTAHQRLESSVRGTKTCALQPQSTPSKAEELIDSTEAAAILHCTDRWARDPRFRHRIGGREVGGRWLYPRETVVAYAARKAGQQQ
ncbi:Uncharacterised protein [Mycolicibacterium vanbaalenii]|uniref:Helix-turn-helix domain-containing protein n=1 Tax=Mycolicibacterium vanbaalenii TaxID=110539 RepID=A0A5S9R8S7_MYCVN|nr:Uncharacterised protein [Mycolicibacterium vanbaalenii]